MESVIWHMKWTGKAVAALGVGVVAAGALYMAGRGGYQLREVQTSSSLPVILDRVQAIGELHTARQNAETVINVETHKQPTGWASGTPIGTFVQASTTNVALVSVKGFVEAGVDLSRTRASWKPTPEGKTLLLEVPNVTVYEPNVDGRVHMTRRGLLWRDDSISLKALDEAKIKFRESARSRGIVREAEENARKSLTTLLKPLHGGPIEVVFGANRS